MAYVIISDMFCKCGLPIVLICPLHIYPNMQKTIQEQSYCEPGIVLHAINIEIAKRSYSVKSLVIK